MELGCTFFFYSISSGILTIELVWALSIKFLSNVCHIGDSTNYSFSIYLPKVVLCRTRLAIRPHSSRAVLFYSQHPNGEVDKSSLHGACPVLSNQKYAANLWVWNTPRSGFAGSPIKKKFQNENGGAVTAPTNMKISAEFENSGQDPTFAEAKLFYQDQFWGSLKPGDPVLGVNTFEGHVWNVKVNKKVVKTWVITEEDGPTQKFVI